MKKIGVSLSEDLLERVEKNRHEYGVSRNEFLRRAISEYVLREEEYRHGYLNYPETEEEIAFAEAALQSISKYMAKELPWECD